MVYATESLVEEKLRCVLWPLSRSFFLLCLAKGVFSPVPRYCGYFVPSHILSLCTFTFWYKINLISFDNSLIIYRFRSKVLVRRIQCLLAQTHCTLTSRPILLAWDSVPPYNLGRHCRQCVLVASIYEQDQCML